MLQRHGPAPEQLTLVDIGPSALASDAYGIHYQSTNLLWHNRVKDSRRLQLIHDLSSRFGCRAEQPKISCNVRRGQAGQCSLGSTWCVFTPPCEPRHFELNYSVQPWGREWVQCEDVSLGRKCKPVRSYQFLPGSQSRS